ncbi:MAG: hypothetical protein KDB13_17055 [Microthrixaceae bacterium]|nr:hypothetical protein [Microthrixaceae bacterium]
MATADQFEPAERLEYEVFEEIGFCRTSSLGRVEEFDEWRDRSEFRVVTDDADVIKGVVRVLLGQYDDLPIGSFPKYRDYPPDPILEYASLAVPVDVRRSGVAEALYRGVWQDAIRSGAGGIAGIGAPWLLDILNGVYNFGFEQLGEGRYYMGGDCIPVGTAVRCLIQRLKNQPSFFQWVTAEVDLRDLPNPGVRDAVADVRRA